MILAEKEDLAFKKTSLERRIRVTAENSIEIDVEYQRLTVELSSWTTIVNNLPDGPAKEAAISKQRKAEYQLFVLEDRRDNYGALAQYEKEFDIGCIDAQLAQVELFITAVRQHQDTLPA